MKRAMQKNREEKEELLEEEMRLVDDQRTEEFFPGLSCNSTTPLDVELKLVSLVSESCKFQCYWLGSRVSIVFVGPVA